MGMCLGKRCRLEMEWYKVEVETGERLRMVEGEGGLSQSCGSSSDVREKRQMNLFIRQYRECFY